MTVTPIGIIILAAGGSTRFGRPKQLLEFEGRTLLRRAAETALSCQSGPVLVVLGNEYEKVRSEIVDMPVETVFNPDWQKGMGSSIGCAVSKVVQERPDISAVIFTLCDQPHVHHTALTRLVEAYLSKNAKIVASEYENTIGVPALFDASLFAELIDLTGDVGAKSIIERHSNNTVKILLPEAAFDIDSALDHNRLISNQEKRTT